MDAGQLVLALRLLGLALLLLGSARACISGYRYRYTGRISTVKLLAWLWLSTVGGLLVKAPVLAVEGLISPRSLATAGLGGLLAVLCFALGVDLASRTRRGPL